MVQCAAEGRFVRVRRLGFSVGRERSLIDTGQGLLARQAAHDFPASAHGKPRALELSQNPRRLTRVFRRPEPLAIDERQRKCDFIDLGVGALYGVTDEIGLHASAQQLLRDTTTTVVRLFLPNLDELLSQAGILQIAKLVEPRDHLIDAWASRLGQLLL